MKKSDKILICLTSIIVIINSILLININKQQDYYIARIESMEKKDGITTASITPIESNRSFASEIKAKHQIEYADDIGITGLKERNKKGKEIYLGQLGKTIENLKSGDSILFKVNKYNKNDYKIRIDHLAVDLTLDE